MKNGLHKIFALTLTATLLLSHAQPVAYAMENKIGEQPGYEVSTVVDYEDFSYDVQNDGTIIIYGYYGTVPNLVIPSMIDGKVVTTIDGGTCNNEKSIVHLTLPETMTRVMSMAFNNCSNLETLIIKGAVTLDYSAFGNCTSLKSVTMDKVTSIGEYTFSNCSSLTEVVIPSGATSIGRYAFQNCTSMKSITIPASVTAIAAEAFSGCSNFTIISPRNSEAHAYANDLGIAWQELEGEAVIPFNYVELDNGTIEITGYTGADTEIEIPSTIEGKIVTSIGATAFGGERDLTQIIIPDTVTKIGNHAFTACSGLTSIIIPESVTAIPDGAFSVCNKLASVELPSTLTSIGSNAFTSCYSLTEIDIPESVTTIGASAFSGCDKITSIVIPSGVTSIADETFSYCTRLQEISIPSGVTSIGARAFENCEALTEIDLPDALLSIGNSAFNLCRGLTTVSIPEKVTSLGTNVFLNCSSLQEVYCPYGLSQWKGNDDTVTWYEYRALTQDTAEFSYYSGNLTSVIVPTIIEDKVVTRIGQKAFEGHSELTSIQIPDSVTSIGESAFVSCAGLTEFKMPASLITIEANAFNNCINLKKLTLPNGVASIGYRAFINCMKMTSITIPASVVEIDATAFDSCNALTIVSPKNSVAHIYAYNHEIPWQQLEGEEVCPYEYEVLSDGTIKLTSYSGIGEEITIPGELDGMVVSQIGDDLFREHTELVAVAIPEGITKIGKNAFSECNNLESIYIPKSVTTIDSAAFKNVTSDLVIKGYAGYAAEECATANGFRFEDLTIYISEITLPESSYTIYVGDSISLTPTVFPQVHEDAIRFTSSNEAVATVSEEGNVEAIGEGTATITVFSKKVSAICTIIVENKVDDDTSGDGTSSDGTPDDGITDDGTTGDGTTDDGTSDDKEDFEDDEEYIKVEKIILSKTSILLKKGKSTRITAVVTPDNADDTDVIWRSSNTKVATVNADGKITAKGYGTAIITAEACDNSGVIATCRVTIGYGITYKLNKGTNHKNNPGVYYKEKITLKSPTRKGYTFKGWYTDKKFKNKITVIKKTDKKNYTLYAKWEKVSVKKTTLSSAKNSKSKSIVLKYKKSSGAKGYEISYSIDKKFKKSVTKKTTTKTSYTIKKLKKGKTYYVRVRAYKLDSKGKKVYSGYSKVIKVKIKK